MTEELKRLGAFAGRLKGETEVASTPFNSNAGINRATVVGRYALEDAFVFVDEVMEQNGKVTFRSHKVFGYDPRKQVYTLHFFDSDGANPPTRAEGMWESEVLTMEQRTPFGFVRYIYEFSTDAYRHRTEVSENGQQWSAFMCGSYRRQD